MRKIAKISRAWWFLTTLFSLWFLFGASAKAESQRIVTIDGALTEIVYALGMGEHVVGRDVTSTYPQEVMKLPSVGYMRGLSAEGILSLDPSLVLVTADAKPRKVLTQLQKAGVKVEIIDNDYSLKGVMKKIEDVARILNVSDKGKQLASKVEQEVMAAQKRASSALKSQYKDGEGPRAIFVLNMRKGNMMVAGGQTRANQLMDMVGVVNPVAGEFNGYKPLTPEAAVKYNPQYILTMQHSVKAAGGLEKMKQSTVLQMTEAGKKEQIVVLANSDLGFGPRLGEALNHLADAVYGSEQVVHQGNP